MSASIRVSAYMGAMRRLTDSALPRKPHCIDESSVLTGFPDKSQIGDKGYVGKRMITPIRKPECRDLLDWEKEFNTQVNKIRYLIEQVIANFKTWRIMHTDYRRPLGTFDTTISAVVGLYFYRMA
jgi:hypothetical protein